MRRAQLVLEVVVERELDGRLGRDLERVGPVAAEEGAHAALGLHARPRLAQRERLDRLLDLQEHLDAVDGRGGGAADDAGEA
jgi:hypothetical protein